MKIYQIKTKELGRKKKKAPRSRTLNTFQEIAPNDLQKLR